MHDGVLTGSRVESARAVRCGAWRSAKRSAGSRASGGERSEPLKGEQDRAQTRGDVMQRLGGYDVLIAILWLHFGSWGIRMVTMIGRGQ